MFSLPEWAPNAHPLFVHFPLALLFTAVFIDLLALVARPFVWLRFTATTTYVLAAVAAVATYFTGEAAADSLTLPAAAQPVLTDHANLATWTVWFFGIYALVRLGVLWFDRRHERLALHIPLFLIALGGLYLPWQTGEHGSMMVYRYGAGVQTETPDTLAQHAAGATHDPAETPADAGPDVQDDGSWQWTPSAGAAEALTGDPFRWITGSPEQARARTVTTEDHGTTLALAPQGTPVLFVVDRAAGSLQADATVNFQDYEGAFLLVHHVADAQNYDFLRVSDATMQLGRVRDGEEEIFDEGTFEGGSWVRLRVVSDEDHFRGYAGDALVAHGHAHEAAAGPVGVRLDGTGTVLLGDLSVTSLR